MRLQAQQLTLLEDSPLSPTAAETFCYAPATAHEEALGNLYLVAELASEKSRKETSLLLSALAQQVRNDFYRKTNTTPIAALRFALKRANKFLAERGSINLSAKIITAALKHKNDSDQFEFHLAKTGQATAIILRENNLNFVFSAPHIVWKRSFQLETSFPNTSNQFENILSSEVWLNDTVLLATNQIHKLSNDKLKKHLAAGLLTQTLKTDSAGLKNLALITLSGSVPKLSLNETPKLSLGADKEVEPTNSMTEEVAVKEVRPPKEAEPRKRKIKIAVLLALIIAVSTGAAVTALKIKKGAAVKKKEAETLVKEVGDIKEKIASMLELNNKTEAEELTVSAMEKLRLLEELGFFKTSRVTLQEELAKISRDLKRVEPINSPRAVVDLTAAPAGFEPHGLSLGKNKIIVFGSNGFYKYDLNLRAGELDLSAGNNLLTVLENTGDPNQLWLLKNDRVITSAKTKDGQTRKELWRRNGEALELREMSYYGDALYLLDKDGLIYKLDLEVATSSNPDIDLATWLNQDPSSKFQVPSSPSTTLGAGKIVSMAVDGAIYGLIGSNKIIKLQNGEVQNQTDLTESADQIVTEPDFDHIYLLSRAESMILVMDKRDRTVKKRLSHPDLGQAKSFAVDSRERTVYFLKDKVIYSFEI